MRNLNRTLLSIAAGLCVAGSAQAGVVDLFTAPPPPAEQRVQTTTNGATDSNQYGPPPVYPAPGSNSIMGNFRDLSVTKVSGSNAGRTTLYVADNTLNFSNDAGANPVVGRGMVQWDGDDGAGDPAINVQGLQENLINQPGCPTTGCDRFQSQILFADLGFNYEINVYSGAANYSKLTALSQFAVDSTNTEIADYLFSWYALAATTGTLTTLQNAPLDVNGRCIGTGLLNGTGGNYYCEDGLAFLMAQGGTKANFSNVSSIEFALNNLTGTGAVDLTIGSITKTVPEPSVLALVGIALLGAGASGIRRRRQGGI